MSEVCVVAAADVSFKKTGRAVHTHVELQGSTTSPSFQHSRASSGKSFLGASYLRLM